MLPVETTEFGGLLRQFVADRRFSRCLIALVGRHHQHRRDFRARGSKIGRPPAARRPSLTHASGAIVRQREICQRRVDHFRGVAIRAGVSALLQLLGGIWILQTLPALVFGHYTNWFRPPSLLAGWAVGFFGGTHLVWINGLKPLQAISPGGQPFTVYIGLLALSGICRQCTPGCSALTYYWRRISTVCLRIAVSKSRLIERGPGLLLVPLEFYS